MRSLNGRRLRKLLRSAAFTLVELMFTVAIIGTLAGIGVPLFIGYKEKARVTEVIIALKEISDYVEIYETENGVLPPDLTAAGKGGALDPWGNPYVYVNLGTAPPGAARKDQFLVPLNSDYDLYSKGEDGLSVPPLTGPQSKDDILRANDGNFYGLGEDY